MWQLLVVLLLCKYSLFILGSFPESHGVKLLKIVNTFKSSQIVFMLYILGFHSNENMYIGVNVTKNTVIYENKKKMFYETYYIDKSLYSDYLLYI